MAGRQTFFSFHYERDVWRATQVRKSATVDASAAAGWNDKSLWEEAKSQGEQAIKRLIQKGLDGTSVTAVLIGAETASRKWVKYEIQESKNRGNGILGVRIHHLKDQHQRTDARGPVPAGVPSNAVYKYEFGKLAGWVEKAAVAAGKPCRQHGDRNCRWCG